MPGRRWRDRGMRGRGRDRTSATPLTPALSPQAGRGGSRGADVFYREAGQYKTTYAADMAIFPIRQDRYGLAVILLVAFVADSRVRQSVPPQYDDDPVPDPLAGARSGSTCSPDIPACCRSEPAPSWASAPMPATSSRRSSRRSIFSSGSSSAAFVSALVGVVFGLPSLRIKGFYLAVATLAAQFFLQWCFARVPWLVNYNDFGRDRGADRDPVRPAGHRSDGDASDALSRRLDHRRRDGLDRLQHRARADRAHVDGGARHGYRRRAHRHPPVARQAPRLRRVVVL